MRKKTKCSLACFMGALLFAKLFLHETRCICAMFICYFVQLSTSIYVFIIRRGLHVEGTETPSGWTCLVRHLIPVGNKPSQESSNKGKRSHLWKDTEVQKAQKAEKDETVLSRNQRVVAWIRVWPFGQRHSEDTLETHWNFHWSTSVGNISQVFNQVRAGLSAQEGVLRLGPSWDAMTVCSWHPFVGTIILRVSCVVDCPNLFLP